MTRRTNPSAWDAAEVARIVQPACDVLIVDRPTPTGLGEFLRAVPIGTFRGKDTRRTADAVLKEAFEQIAIDHPTARDDATAISRSFLAQFGLRRANLRLELVDRQSCPKFHHDRVSIRLIVSFAGGGTQYVHRIDPDRIHQAETGALVFLKGATHPTFAESVFHRSPPTKSGERRLCLVLDF